MIDSLTVDVLCAQRTPVDVERLDEFGAQLYLGPMAPVHSAGRSPSTIVAYQLHMLRSGRSFVPALSYITSHYIKVI